MYLDRREGNEVYECDFPSAGSAEMNSTEKEMVKEGVEGAGLPAEKEPDVCVLLKVGSLPCHRVYLFVLSLFPLHPSHPPPPPQKKTTFFFFVSEEKNGFWFCSLFLHTRTIPYNTHLLHRFIDL